MSQAKEEWYSSLQRATKGGRILGRAGIISSTRVKWRGVGTDTGSAHLHKELKLSLVSLAVLGVNAEKKQVLFLFQSILGSKD